MVIWLNNVHYLRYHLDTLHCVNIFMKFTYWIVCFYFLIVVQMGYSCNNYLEGRINFTSIKLFKQSVAVHNRGHSFKIGKLFFSVAYHWVLRRWCWCSEKTRVFTQRKREMEKTDIFSSIFGVLFEIKCKNPLEVIQRTPLCIMGFLTECIKHWEEFWTLLKKK